MRNSKIIMIVMPVILATTFFAVAMAQTTATSPNTATQKQSGTTTQTTQPIAKPAPVAKPTAIKPAAANESTGTTNIQPAGAPTVVKSDVKTAVKSQATTSNKIQDKAKKDAASKAKTASGDIATTMIGLADAKTFTTDLEKSGLFPMLKNTGPFTVFVPSDSAFAKLSKEAKDSLENDMPRLIDVLKYHIVHGMQDEASLLKTNTVMTTDRRDVMIMNHGGKLMVGDAWVTKADIKCSNGIIHIIDSVLEPPVKGQPMEMEKSGGMTPSGK